MSIGVRNSDDPCYLREPREETLRPRYPRRLQPPGLVSVVGAEVKQTEGRFLLDVLRIIIAILLPPLGVFLQVGIGKQFWINILLTILGYIPGIIHAVWVIAKY